MCDTTVDRKDFFLTVEKDVVKMMLVQNLTVPCSL